MSLLSEINLAPSDQFSKSNILDKLYIWGSFAGKTLIIITNFVIISVWLYRWDLDRRIYNLATSIEEKQLAITSISKKEETIRKIQTKLNIIRDIESDKSYYSALLQNLNQTAVEGVELKRVTFPSSKLVNISASAKDGPTFGLYVGKLINDLKIEDVTLYGSSLEATTETYEFVIELQYK